MHLSLLTRWVLLVVLTAGLSSAHGETSRTLPLNIALGKGLVLSATVTIEEAVIETRQLTLAASIAGSLLVNGTSASLASQPIAIQAATTHSSGGGSVKLMTSSLSAQLPSGVEVVIEPMTLTVSTACGKAAALNVSSTPVKLSLTDGTTIPVPSLAIVATTRPASTLGQSITATRALTGDLHEILSRRGSVDEALTRLTGILTAVSST